MCYPDVEAESLASENRVLKQELDKMLCEREKLRAENAELHSRLKQSEYEIHHMKGQLDMVHLIFDRRNHP